MFTKFSEETIFCFFFRRKVCGVLKVHCDLDFNTFKVLDQSRLLSTITLKVSVLTRAVCLSRFNDWSSRKDRYFDKTPSFRVTSKFRDKDPDFRQSEDSEVSSPILDFIVNGLVCRKFPNDRFYISPEFFIVLFLG